MKKNIKYNDQLPPIRILLLEASDICYANKTKNESLIIKNYKDKFHKNFKDLMPLNLDLYYLFDQQKLVLDELEGEFFTYCLINVNFEWPLYLNENKNRVYKSSESDKESSLSTKELRKELYENGFILNKHKYVRYKRSASSARSGTCLFIRSELYSLLDKWSKAGLDKKYDKKCFDNLTSYEAYRALSLSSLSKTVLLNPYNILFVKDFEYVLKNQEVIKVTCNNKKQLEASKESCDVKNNIFDGEGLLDITIFEKCGYYEENHKKGMMLLRNRFFKCCAFNTNLQAWFKENDIKDVGQLNGFTLAKRVEDIVLVVSESCLKYFKLAYGGFSLDTVKRWCDAVSEPNQLSRFGIVKTDKPTRFFNGDMVETNYQLINTLQLQQSTDCRPLLYDYIDYIKKIRNIAETPEYARFFLTGEVNDIDINEFEDDSEDQEYDEALFDYSSYLFKSKVCLDLIKINSDFIKTEIFKNHLFRDIINAFRLKLYNGRVLVKGTYATLFGNPIEYLKYIIKKFDENHITTTLKDGEIYSPFFKIGEKLVGSRSPHMSMGNILVVTNAQIPEIDKWFNLTRNIVVVDSINNNIQQRLNGCDFDSDTMLLTNNQLIVTKANDNYDKFLVPFVAFEPEKTNAIHDLCEIDNKIANNKVGEIVNLAQFLNSHLWDRLNSDKNFDYEDIYNKIAILSVLAGCEIDSAKRTFAFKTTSVLAKVRKYAKDNGYIKKPAFFFYVAGGEKERPKIGKIDKYVAGLTDQDRLSTAMDYLWEYAYGEISAPDIKTIKKVSTLIKKSISTKGLSKAKYDQIKKAKEKLIETRNIINRKKYMSKDNAEYEIQKIEFNDDINECYKTIKYGINDIRKTKVLIKKIEKEKTPHSLLAILFYIISVKRKELDYDLENLFESDGGVPALEEDEKKKGQFVLFNEYYYQHSAFHKIIAGIKTMGKIKNSSKRK